MATLSVSSGKALLSKNRNVLAEGSAAICAVGIILMLVVPLPNWILDLFLALNITLALGILMMTFYVRKSLEFSSFPSQIGRASCRERVCLAV